MADREKVAMDTHLGPRGTHRSRGFKRRVVPAALVAVGLAMLTTVDAHAAVPDAYEPDDTVAQASAITVDAPPQQHSIHVETDVDWASFQVEAGVAYLVETLPGEVPDDPSTSTSLFGSDGVTEVGDSGWRPGAYEIVEYEAQQAGTLHVRVEGGYTGTYAVHVERIGDAFEPDDSRTQARPITVGAPAQQHTIHDSTDADWVAFEAEAGWRYTIRTSPGSPPTTSQDTELWMCDSTGEYLDSDYDGGDGYYSLIEHVPEQTGTLYVEVEGTYGTYALSVTRQPLALIEATPAALDFGEVRVGDEARRVVLVENRGTAPLEVGAVSLDSPGFTVVRDEASGTTIPVGEARDVEVRYAPTADLVHTGTPRPTETTGSNQVAEYTYNGGVLVGVTLVTGFQNHGGAGQLPWRVRVGGVESTGSLAVVAGGRYDMRIAVTPGATVPVQVLEPVGDFFDIASAGAPLRSVQYQRVADGFLEIDSNAEEEPSLWVDLLGIALPEDTAPPTVAVTGVKAGAWYRTAVTATLTATDEAGGSGVASVGHNLDGTGWTTVAGRTTSVEVPLLPNGKHVLVHRATDVAGNVSPDGTVRFTVDSVGPVTTARYVTGRVDRLIPLRYRVGDALSPRATGIRIVVRNSAGQRVKTFWPSAKNTGTWYSVSWRPSRRGTYRYQVYAKDLAGNAQRTAGIAKVVVTR